MAIHKMKPAEEELALAPAPAPRDHNKPPLEELIPLEFREKLLEERSDFLKTMDDYLGVGSQDSEDFKAGAVHRATCSNEEDLGKCGKMIVALRKLEQHIEFTHTAVKAPYLQAGRLVDSEKNELVLRIKVGRQRVQWLMDEYAAEELKKKRQREAEAEEQRLKELEERRKLEELAKENNLEAALPPPPPPPPPIAPAKSAPLRTDGATVSIGTEWDFEIEDYAKAFRKVKDDAKVREAIEAAIRKMVKATKGKMIIPGVRQFERAKTTAR